MATHSIILVWKISWIKEPDGLQQPMGSQKEMGKTSQLKEIFISCLSIILKNQQQWLKLKLLIHTTMWMNLTDIEMRQRIWTENSSSM